MITFSDNILQKMSKIWNYFTKSAGKAFCKTENCNYSIDFPPKSPTTTLIYHIKKHHKELHKQFKADQVADNKDAHAQPTRQKREYFSSSGGLSQKLGFKLCIKNCPGSPNFRMRVFSLMGILTSLI
jgi:hypothetical protein